MEQGNSERTTLLTAQEVAARLRIPVSTVYHLAKTGQLAAVRIGRAVRFHSHEIEALLSGESPKSRILIVDDDATILTFAGALLEQEGHEIETASSKETAYALAADHSFDLLLVDIVLPDGSGAVLVEELAAVYQPEQFIVMTAHADLPEVDALLARHHITLLRKPVDPDHLVHCVNARLVPSGLKEGDTDKGNPSERAEREPSADKTLLIVDDDRTIRRLVSHAMGRQGYEVICVETAEEGVDLLEKGAAPVALVDLNLPGMSGREVVRQFADDSSVAIIVFSGGDMDYSYERAMKEGAADYLLKPMELKELALRVEKALATTTARAAR